MVYEELKRLTSFLPLVLVVYGTSRYTTQAMLFFLVYGVDAMISIEVTVPSAHLALKNKVSDPNDHIYDVETLEEKRQMQKKT